MTLSFEIMLVLGVIGFYMLDSLMLLYVNELIYVQANTKGQWFFICPKLRWQILGKVPCIPNPLTPSSPLFRVSWPVSSPSELQEDSESLQRFLNTLNPLRYFTILLFFLLVVGLPFVLFSFGGGFELLILIGLIYINISIMLIQTYRQRKYLGLSIKIFTKLAFDSLVCAPLALNLVRKISLNRPIFGDPIKLAQQIFDDSTFYQLVSVLCNRINEELEFEDEESLRHDELTNYKNYLANLRL